MCDPSCLCSRLLRLGLYAVNLQQLNQFSLASLLNLTDIDIIWFNNRWQSQHLTEITATHDFWGSVWNIFLQTLRTANNLKEINLILIEPCDNDHDPFSAECPYIQAMEKYDYAGLGAVLSKFENLFCVEFALRLDNWCPEEEPFSAWRPYDKLKNAIWDSLDDGVRSRTLLGTIGKNDGRLVRERHCGCIWGYFTIDPLSRYPTTFLHVCADCRPEVIAFSQAHGAPILNVE